MKVIKQVDIRAILDLYVKDDISYSRMNKMFNEKADNFAIEFGKWLNNQVINSSGKYHNLLGSTKVTQLLPIFKKEKGL